MEWKESAPQCGLHGTAGEQAKIIFLWESMNGWVDAKTLEEDFESFGFTPRKFSKFWFQPKLETGNEVEKRRTHS